MLESYNQAAGYDRIIILTGIRTLLRQHPVVDVGRMIMKIENMKFLDIILGAGLKEPLYSVAISRRVMLKYPEIFRR